MTATDPLFSDHDITSNKDIVSSIEIPIRNLGFGPAKYININSDYDINAINKTFKKVYGVKYFVEFEGESFKGVEGIDFVEIASYTTTDSITSFSESRQAVDYLAPSLEKNIFNSIRIPFALELLTAYNSAMANMHSISPEEIEARISITYLNINGSKFKKNYTCTMNPSAYSTCIDIRFEEL